MSGRRRRLTAPRDEGVSLAEMLVAMLIAAVLMLAMSTLFISSLRENRTVIGKTNSTTDASTAMEALTRDLRVAVQPPGQPAAIVSASPTAISLYSSLGTTTATSDPNPSLVSFTIDTTRRCLWREITPATVVGTVWSWPTANKKGSCVGRGDINTNGAALLTYYPINADGTISTTAFTTGAISANLSNIAAIGLNLSFKDTDNGKVAPTTLQDQVTLINIAQGLQVG